jgi:hypothetical protein
MGGLDGGLMTVPKVEAPDVWRRWSWRGSVAFDEAGGEVGRMGVAGAFVPAESYAYDDATWPMRGRAARWAGVRPPPGGRADRRPRF